MAPPKIWLGVTCGLAIGLGAVAAVGVTTQNASAASTFTVTPQQLQINQNISSAAVKRSNRALNYLAPIRTTQTDAADDGSNGVKALNSIPGSGTGWAVGQLAPGQKQYWINVGPTGTITAQSGSAGTFTATRAGLGDYVVDFKTPITACSVTASPFTPTPPGTLSFAFSTGVVNQPTQVNVRTLNAAQAAADSTFTVQLLC